MNLSRPRTFRLSLAAFAAVLVLLSIPTVYAADGLTESQTRSGWVELFDGETTDGWRQYGGKPIGKGWTVSDGVLSYSGRDGGDLITEAQYGAFELMLEYKIAEGANSGVLFHVVEGDGPPWHSGPEIQIYDDKGRENAQKSGWLYSLYKPSVPKWADQSAPPVDSTRPPGQWNQLYLRVSPEQSEVCVNGLMYYRFTKGNKDWAKRVADSKFSKFPQFGAAEEGHVCLQAHGGAVAFRNLKLRQLGEGGEVQQPIDGKLDVATELAFPKLKWDGWEAIDDSGKVSALRFMGLTAPKDGSNRLFAVSQGGKIFVFENRRDVEESTLFLDLTAQTAQWKDRGGNEQGLLGMAPHPNFADNGYVYVYYSHVDGDRSVVSRFKVSADNPNVADPDSETVVLSLPQPFKNHNGGSIEFGPDGMLYIGMGDGGDRNDPHGNGQDVTTLLGSVLRIDVDNPAAGLGYGIPSDNPFASEQDAAAGRRGEIFAHGVRNIWRLAFDSATGTLWAGDVGQELSEEINIIRKGGNYGWSVREGFDAFGNRNPEILGTLVDPVWEYDHRVGRSITGGRVYRSNRVAELAGRYLYADYVSGRVWALNYDESSGKVISNDEIIDGGIPVLAFGEDAAGEVYYMTASMKGDCIFRFIQK